MYEEIPTRGVGAQVCFFFEINELINLYMIRPFIIFIFSEREDLERFPGQLFAVIHSLRRFPNLHTSF